MKRCLLLAVVFLAACAPEVEAVQTAIAQIRGPQETPTLTPVPKALQRSTAAPTPMVGCAEGVNLRIRSEPNTHSNIVGGLMAGTCIDVYGTNEDRTWARVDDGEISGWASLKYLAIRGNGEALPVVQ